MSRLPTPKPVVVGQDVVWGARPETAGSFAAHHRLPRWLPPISSAPLGVFCVDTHDPVIGLTYDDGPNPEHTPRILDLLAERGCSATFYVLARQATKHPDIVRRIVADGHELALHGDNHDSLRTMSTLSAVRRIRDARRVVEEIAGVRLRTYRPPYGQFSLAQAVGIWALGLRLIIWSGDADDWLHDEESAIAARSIAGMFPGAILLLHDDRGDPEKAGPDERLPAFDRAEVLRLVLAGADERALELSGITELLHRRAEVRSLVRPWDG